MPENDHAAPILLVQWLGSNEYKETNAALSKFKDQVSIAHADVSSKADVLAAIGDWLTDNDNAQFLFIGTHGNDNGIGSDAADMVGWSELWEMLKKAGDAIAVWLGACHSAHAAEAWSPVCDGAPVEYVVGFPVAINASEIEKVLNELLRMTDTQSIVYVDEEIPQLRSAIAKTNVAMHYKARTTGGQIEYVDYDEFPARVGKSLKEYLETSC
jgi:hypothetical protein